MLDFREIEVRYGLQEVLGNVTFRVNKGERVGIVGPNGSGKSTLFKIVLGELTPDKGELVIEENPRIGATRQNPQPDSPEETLLEYALRGVSGFTELEEEMKSLERQLAEDFNAENAEAPQKNAESASLCGDSANSALKKRLLSRLGEVQTQFEHIGGWDLETRIKGFAEKQFAEPFAALSGGWRMRAELSRVLASEPDLLLLDEPSNYLDVPAVEWLERFLKSYKGTLMLISHDRFLLRALTNRIVEVDAATATRYEGNLDWYLREREVRYQHLVAAKENQDHHREQLQRFVDRFRAQATKAAQAPSRQKIIDKLDAERIVLPKRYSRRGRLRLAEPPPSGIDMFRAEWMCFSYDGEREVLHDVNFQIMRGEKVAIIGYNGLGKTTIMRLIAGTRKPTKGKAILGHNVATGYLSQEFAETIPPDLSVYRIAKNAWQGGLAKEKEFRNQMGAFGFDENDVEKQAGVLSGGEKIRLAFLRLFLATPNFLLLDEPTTHLDLDGRNLLQEALAQYKGTVLFVSHDIEFVRAVANRIIEITPQGVRSFPGGYDYYREKSGELHAAAGAPPKEVQAQTANSKKELRKERAEARAKIAPQVKALKGKILNCETKLESLQHDLDEASEVLFNPKPGTDFAEANRKVRVIQSEIDRYTADWEEASLALEELTAGE